MSTRSLTRFFGSAEWGTHLIQGHQGATVLPVYMEWLAVDYRSTKQSRAAIADMLTLPLSDVEKTLLEARLEARPSLYKIESIEEGESLTFLDLISGEHVVVHDCLLSESAQTDLILPARLIHVGSFHLPNILGPGMRRPTSAAAGSPVWRPSSAARTGSR